jgi:hypothetical protein
MATFLPNGIGETLGDQLVTGRPLTTTGSVYYVSSATGDPTYTGLNKERPLATLSSAQSAASDGDIIVLLDGHTETYTGALTITKKLTIVGSGSSNGVPTCSFGMNADATLWTITSAAAGIQIRNVKFRTNLVSSTAQRIDTDAANGVFAGCYFEMSGFDQGPGLFIGTGTASVRVEETTFVSTATSIPTAPAAGLRTEGTTTDLWIVGCTFDGGAYGWSGYAYDELGAATRRRGEQVSLIRGSDANLHASSVQSYWMPTTTSGAVRS